MERAGPYVLMLLGAAMLFFTWQDVVQGRVEFIWTRLWTPAGSTAFKSSFERERSPVGFWAATTVHAVCGVGLLLFGLSDLL